MKKDTEESPDSAPRIVDDVPAPGFSIRPARPDDAELLVNLVRELAVYEKLEQHARATPDDFRRHLFGPRPAAEAAVAEVEGGPIGFALWFSTFSTFRGQPGLYLEDVFVKPGFRGRGIGKGLLAAVARRAVERHQHAGLFHLPERLRVLSDGLCQRRGDGAVRHRFGVDAGAIPAAGPLGAL